MMSLRNSRALAVVAAVVGALLLVVGVLSGALLQIVPGVLLAVLGVLMLFNPMVVFTESEVQVLSPLGFTVRRFPISGPADVRVDGNKLLHAPTGKRIASLGFGVEAADAQRVREWAGGVS